jgi:hypothetical protein
VSARARSHSLSTQLPHLLLMTPEPHLPTTPVAVSKMGNPWLGGLALYIAVTLMASAETFVGWMHPMHPTRKSNSTREAELCVPLRLDGFERDWGVTCFVCAFGEG